MVRFPFYCAHSQKLESLFSLPYALLKTHNLSLPPPPLQSFSNKSQWCKREEERERLGSFSFYSTDFYHASQKQFLYTAITSVHILLAEVRHNTREKLVIKIFEEGEKLQKVELCGYMCFSLASRSFTLPMPLSWRRSLCSKDRTRIVVPQESFQRSSTDSNAGIQHRVTCAKPNGLQYC